METKKQLNCTFGDIAEKWFLLKQTQIKESTCAKYRIILQVYLYPLLHDTAAEEIDSQRIEQLCSELLHKGGKKQSGLSPKTVSDILSVLREILRFGQQENMIAAPKGLDRIRIRQSRKQLVVFTPEEQLRLYEYLISSDSLLDLGILFSLLTGLRIGEVCALKWQDIDMEKGYIQVSRTMQRLPLNHPDHKTAICITSPKSSSSIRMIPIPDPLHHYLMQHQPHTGYILTASEEKFVEPRSMQYHFQKILSICNLPSGTYHTLRHTFATRCVELGFDIKSLSEILGHSSVSITMNRYVHPSLEMKKQNMKRLSEVFPVS